MSALSGPLSEYLLVRRALGYKLERAEKLLGQFVSYCEAVEAPLVTTELAVGWAKLPAEGGQFWWAQRPAWCGASPGGCKPKSPPQRSLRQASSARSAHRVPSPTSIPTPRSAP